MQTPHILRLLIIRATLIAGSTALALVAVELALRALDHQFHLAPAVEFGWPTPQIIAYAYDADRDTFWNTRNFDDRLASAKRRRPTVVFLGDSCTEFGTYPAMTLERLRTSAPDLASGVAFGVGGWSLEQGVALFRRDVVSLKPRVVTIYFGWNDHWVALGPTDPELMRIRTLVWLGDRFRLPQMLLKATVARSGPREQRPNRVPIERYRALLNAIIREAKTNGIEPILITAPSNHVVGQEPDYLKVRNVRTLAELVPLHTMYLQATRDAAREGRATLCDAANRFRRLPEQLSTYFHSDGIHLTGDGDRALADILASCVLNAVSR